MKKMNILFTIMMCSIMSSLLFAQSDTIDYLGQEPPGNTPEVFSPGIISIAGRKERSFTISPEGDEIFFCKAGFPLSKIYHMVKTDTGWTSPQVAEFVKDDFATEPALSPDGKTMYFSTMRGKSDTNNYNLWKVKKEDDAWSEPESLFDIDSNKISEFHPSVTQNSVIYFCWWKRSNSTGKIYYAKPGPEGYSEIIKLGKPVNTRYQDCDPFIAPDESYLIFKSDRTGGYGDMDLYISYKKENGNWTNPKNLGPEINTTGDDDVGDISPDGKYMFFTKNDDIYWVDAGFIDSLKLTNYHPYILKSIPDTNASLNELFLFELDDSTFIDDDENEVLTLSAEQSNGELLPGWLRFNDTTHTFSGTPAETGSIYVKVTASDSSASVSDIFRIIIDAGSSIEGKKEIGEILIYPNPAINEIQITFNSEVIHVTSYQIIDINGKIIKQGKLETRSIDISKLNKGLYLIRLNINDKIYCKKIVIE